MWLLKQGCLLSPLLFNICIDDLIPDMKLLNRGIEVENDKICILTYADDVILVANTEEELQSLLNCLNSWSKQNCLIINKDKSKIIYFKRPLTSCTLFSFSCVDWNLDITSLYKYLRL